MHNAAKHPDAIQKSFVKSIGQDFFTPLFFICIINKKTLTKSQIHSAQQLPYMYLHLFVFKL